MSKQNLRTVAVVGAEKSVTAKWTNKGNDKHEEADSLSYNTKKNTPSISIYVKFQNPRHSISLTQMSLCITMEWEMKKEKWKNKVKQISTSCFSFPQYTLPLAMGLQNLKTQNLRNQWQKNWLKRKKNRQIKGMINMRRLILFHTIKKAYPICVSNSNS